MDAQNLREFVTDAIRFWEPLRVAYNTVLGAIVLIYFAIGYPASKTPGPSGSVAKTFAAWLPSGVLESAP